MRYLIDNQTRTKISDPWKRDQEILIKQSSKSRLQEESRIIILVVSALETSKKKIWRLCGYEVASLFLFYQRQKSKA